MTPPTPKVTKVDGVVLWRYDADRINPFYESGKKSWDDSPPPADWKPDEYVALPRADHDRLVGALAAARDALERADSLTPTSDPRTLAVLDAIRQIEVGGAVADDLAVAAVVGIEPVRASQILRWLQRAGLIGPALALSPQAGDDAKVSP